MSKTDSTDSLTDHFEVRRPLFRSVVLLNLGLALLLTVAAVVAAYLAVGKGVEASARADIEAEIRVLDQHGESHDGFGYANAVNFRILPHEDAKAVTLSVQDEPIATPSLSVYMVLRRDRSAVVGNLQQIPEQVPLTTGWFEFDGADAGVAPGTIIAKVKGVHRNRYFLLVGRRLATYDALYQSFIPAMALIALAVTGLSLLMIGFTARRFGSRIGVLNDVFRSVRHGDVRARVDQAETGQEDELGLLATEINTALDEIARLMHGLDSVSQTAAHELNKEVSRLQQLAAVSHDAELKDAVDALLALLRELLELAKVGSASTYTMQHIPLDACVDEAVSLYQDAFDEHGVSLNSVCRSASPNILGRATLITNLVTNLLDNALKHTPQGGSVTVEIEDVQNAIQLSVTDTGVGTETEDISMLIARGASGPVAGYGFGLRFIQAVAIRHGARIRLQNQQPGLKVRLLFPAI